jgi:TPR repeat protein
VNRYLILVVAACIPIAAARAGIVEGDQAFAAGDFERAYTELLPIARGNSLAAYYLGVMYMEGMWVGPSTERGIRWLTLGASRGHAAAQLRLALAYQDGEGVAQNYPTAAQWMLESADGGNADAQYLLGQYYRDGLGVVQDDRSAYEWVSRSVEYGVSHDRLLDALFFLGAACEWGRGLRQDLTEAYKWFSLASGYSMNDATMRDEAIRALGALRIRMNGIQLAAAGQRAHEWREAKQSMYGASVSQDGADGAQASLY